MFAPNLIVLQMQRLGSKWEKGYQNSDTDQGAGQGTSTALIKVDVIKSYKYH